MFLSGNIRWLPVKLTAPIPGSMETLVAEETLHIKLELSPLPTISGFALKEPIDGRFA